MCSVKAMNTYKFDDTIDSEALNKIYFRENEMGIAVEGTPDDEILDDSTFYLEQCEVVSRD